ncbi:unnamed protein product [Cylicocyclus nassatus]|uniref:PDZ domain-containing protein n=1 Tax=Cylicocyclus nassatus TaxID=53992 RepID=A0AA36DMY0_CYLNA|nr:unnamed protein product [Cylicocyclus nassatus]
MSSDSPEQEQYYLTPERQRNFVPKPGFAYFLVILRVTPGLRFGLGIKTYRNLVIVSRVEPGTLSADALQVADRIVDVNGKPVSDKDVAKTLILRSLQADGSVNMIVERAVEPAAKATMEGYLNASLYQPPSVAMASDVKSIVQRYFEKLKKGPSAKPVPALRRSNREYGRVQFQEGATHKSVQIGVDHQSKVHLLRKVPQRQPPPPHRDSAEGSGE